MSKIIKIYCEGKQGSHDYDILQKVIGDLSVFIEPIGSIRGAGAIIQYKKAKEVVKSDFLTWFQGKDFEAALQILLPSFPTKSYYKFAKNNFNYELFPDLVELRTLLQNKLQ